MDILILVGTQTNTAKNAGEEMAREAFLRGLKPRVFLMDDFPVIKLPEQTRVVFIVATTGEGEAPASMIKTWRFLLRKDLPSNSLTQINFAVFGLGDSSYEFFNAMATKLTKRLLQLGATQMIETGLGDYQHDFEYQGEFDPWLE